MVFLKSDLSIVELVKCANVRQCEYDHKWMNTSMIPVSHKLPVVLICFSYSRQENLSHHAHATHFNNLTANRN